MTEDKAWARHRLFWGLCLAFIIYSALVYTSGTATHGVASEAVLDGKQVYRQRNCVACHQIYGLGGYMGPDLTNIISDPFKGPDYARGFLEFGTRKMPDYQLTGEEVDALLAYLDFVDDAGLYFAGKGKATWYGTVDYQRAR